MSLKVLWLPSWYPTDDNPATGSFFVEQSAALARRGISVAVAYCDVRVKFNNNPELKIYTENDVVNFISGKRNLTPFCEKGIRFQQGNMLIKLFPEILKRFGRPDVVHLHSCLLAEPAVRLCKKYGLPMAFTEHSSQVAFGKYKNELKKALDFAEASSCVGQGLLDIIKGFSRDAALIPNMVNTGVFVPDGSEHEKFTFGAMGALRPHKGFDTLIRAFKLFSDSCDARLVIAGQGQEEEPLRRLIASLGLDEKVTLTGQIARAEVPGFMNSLDCFVLSSVREPFGVVIIEALACGKPVIATRSGGPEGIINDKNGILVSADDDKGMAAALEIMFHNRESYDGKAICGDCENRFGENAVSDRIISMYKGITGNDT